MRLTSGHSYSEGEPHDRLTRIADAMGKAAEEHPEHQDGDKFIIMVDGGSEGGMTARGFDDASELFMSLLAHTEALAARIGVLFRVMGVEQEMSSPEQN